MSEDKKKNIVNTPELQARLQKVISKFLDEVREESDHEPVTVKDESTPEDIAQGKMSLSMTVHDPVLICHLYEARLNEALSMAVTGGVADDSHRKQWALDQIIRILLGTPKTYEDWLKDFNRNPIYDDWDPGIA